MKKENGITLVALIISIIVLLILAIVSISLVINNGILDKAKSAVEKYSKDEMCEQIKLAYQEYQMGKYTDNNSFENILKRIFGSENVKRVSINNNKINITINDKIYQYNINSGISKELKIQTIGMLTKGNYGEYLNLEKSFVGSNETTDDWQIIYNDTKEGKVYAILADYLPNSTGIATLAGLDTISEKEYNVNKSSSRNELVQGFDSNAWKENMLPASLQSNSKIILKGAMSKIKIFESYNEKHNCTLDTDPYTWQYLYLDREDTSKGLDPLYIPHQEKLSDCEGYWTYNIRASMGMWTIFYDGGVKNNGYNQKNVGIRPVAILDSDIVVEKENIGNKIVWNIVE